MHGVGVEAERVHAVVVEDVTVEAVVVPHLGGKERGMRGGAWCFYSMRLACNRRTYGSKSDEETGSKSGNSRFHLPSLLSFRFSSVRGKKAEAKEQKPGLQCN